MYWYIIFIFYLGNTPTNQPAYIEYQKEIFTNRWDCATYLEEHRNELLEGILQAKPNIDKVRSNILCVDERKLQELEESNDRVKYRKYIKNNAPVAEWFSKVFVSPRRGFDSLRGLQLSINA